VKESKKMKSQVTLVLSLLLICSLLANVYQGYSCQGAFEKNESLIDNMSKQYSDISDLYQESLALVQGFKADNNQLSVELSGKVDELTTLKNEIEKIKRSVKNKKQKFKQLEELYGRVVLLNKQLEDKIDEILLENKQLYEKNDSLKEDVLALTQEKSSLGEKINSGSKIKAEYVTASAFKRRSNGMHKETVMAKRTNKIEVNFTLLENPIAPQGEKTVYVRIVAPNEVELGNPAMGSGDFVVVGNEDVNKYSVKKVYTYTGGNQEMTVSYEEESKDIVFEKGLYRIEVYVDNYLSGRSGCYLK